MFCAHALAQLTLSQPATYRVTVRGRLDNSWVEQLGCIGICPVALDEHIAATVLTATFRDQAELLGLLNRLYNLGFPLYRVECLALAPGS